MTLSAAEIDKAKVLLAPPQDRPANALGALGAAALAAAAAVTMAGVMVLGPGIALEDTPTAVAQP